MVWGPNLAHGQFYMAQELRVGFVSFKWLGEISCKLHEIQNTYA
jgi:hypothetical protein